MATKKCTSAVRSILHNVRHHDMVNSTSVIPCGKFVAQETLSGMYLRLQHLNAMPDVIQMRCGPGEGPGCNSTCDYSDIFPATCQNRASPHLHTSNDSISTLWGGVFPAHSAQDFTFTSDGAQTSKQLRAGPAKNWTNHRHIVSREPLRRTWNLGALTLTQHYYCTRRKKRYIKIKKFYISTRCRRDIGENSKTLVRVTFEHKIRKNEIVVPDQGENWWRHSWRPYEKTDIVSVPNSPPIKRYRQNTIPVHDTSSFHHFLFFCDATCKFASLDLKNTTRICTTYANKRRARPLFV